ncbi:glycosyltransferase [Paenibacillus silvae]|uniref:glycosyltransferase family 2 protein n=1 Tax=Paenibacillus silvae TaxID=1325358 RepID=UPI0025A1D6E6|nr:glycosyltransferase [Paenibacillus silvae]MDM5281348.1 glycosyltransferase [Paenibacillus silvae]
MELQELERIVSKIEAGEIGQALSQLILFHEQIMSSPSKYSVDEKAFFYKTFGEILFQLGHYDQAIGIFRLAQAEKYSNDINDLIYNAFILPNMAEFEQNYTTNITSLQTDSPKRQFSELAYHLIPTEIENKYYLYHKSRKTIEDSFVLFGHEPGLIAARNSADLLASFLYVEKYEIGNVLSNLTEILDEGLECYVIIEEYDKFLSTLQGGIEEKLDKLRIFSSYSEINYYFENRTEYLPRNIVSYSADIQKAESYIQHLHRHRLLVQNKRRDRILLSICIPTYNRGHRALDNVIQSLNNVYDFELEVVISNNGTRNETMHSYEEIKNYPDSRVTYFEFADNQGFYANVVNVCRIASGKFVLLLSDEDIVDTQVLEEIMCFLQSNPDMALVKTSTTTQAKFQDASAFAGEEALNKFMLRSNYMSGMIINRELLIQKNVIEQMHELYIKGNVTTLIYPHMCWELLMCQYGNVHSTSLVLVREGKPEKMESEYIVKINSSAEVPEYATVESRLSQHNGFFEIMSTMEISKNAGVMQNMYINLCSKTFWLIKISIDCFYRAFSSKEDLLQILNKTYLFCTDNRYLEYCIDRKNVISNIDELYSEIAKHI